MISVCIATYNGEKYIIEQLESILQQIGEIDEIVISDDYSTDNTLKLIKNLNDKRIKIIKNNRGKGYSMNFENAILNARGQIIFLSDQDDIWLNKKVDMMLKELIDHDIVISDAKFVDEKLNDIGITYFSLRGGKSGFINNFYKSQYLGSCIAFNKNIFKKLIPFPQNHILCPHDLWISLVGEFFYNVKVIKEPLILYRRHRENTSTGGIKSNNSLMIKILFRIYVFNKIILRWLKY